MNHPINGSSSDPFSKTAADVGTTSFGETSIQQPTSTQASKAAISADFQVFEGTDNFDIGTTVTQQFASMQPRGIYQADPHRPKLTIEPDPDGLTGPQPYEPDSQIAIKNFFKDRLRELLRKKETGIQAATVQVMEDSLTKEIKEKEADKSNTPKNQSAKGAAEKEEGEGPELPLPQVEKEVTLIVSSVISGKIATLSESQKKLAVETTKETQEAWGLPASWSVGSHQKLDWTPIKKVDPPVNIDLARKEFLAANMTELLEAMQKAGQKVIDSLSSVEHIRIPVADLIQVISQAIRGLKEALRNLQMKESDTSIKLSDAKFGAIKDRENSINDQIEKNKEISETRAKQEEKAKTAKIVSCIVSVIATIVGAILLPFTAGMSTALIIAGIAVAAAMTAYTIVDATFNVTTKLLTAFNKCLEGMFPGEENNWKRTLVKAAIIACVVAILVVAVVATGGGAAANIATQTASQIAKTAVLETLKQLSLQAIMITIMSSNIIPELFSTALIESGVLNREDKEGKMWAEMAMMAVTMLTMMAIVATGGKGVGSIKEIGKGISEGAKSVGRTIANTLKSMVEILTDLKSSLAKLGEGIQQLIQTLIKMLSSLLNAIKNAPRDLVVGSKDLAISLLFVFRDMADIIKHIIGTRSLDKETMAAITHHLETLIYTLKLAGLGTEIAVGIIVGILGMKLSDLLKEVGLIEKAQEITQLLIKLFDQLLNSFQDDLGKISDWLKSLQHAMDSTFASADQTLARASRVPI